MLDHHEMERYARHLSLDEIGEAGQLRLSRARVLVVGAGGLGCPILQYLAAAGVGKLGIVDGDVVSLSNLPRQTLYTTHDIGKPKAALARRRLAEMNNRIDVFAYPVYLDAQNALDIAQDYDILVDATDNFAARYLLNDLSVLLHKPLVFGAIHRFEGQVSVFNLPDAEGSPGASYRCVFPVMPSPDEAPNCTEAGVLGVLPGIIGSLQANEVLKICLHIGEPLRNKLLVLDALTLQSRIIRLRRTTDYSHQRGLSAADYAPLCAPATLPTISYPTFQNRLSTGEAWQVIDVRSPQEYAQGHLAGALLIPHQHISTHREAISRQMPVLVYCARGTRSAGVVRLLRESYNFEQVYSLEGGIQSLNISPVAP